MGIFKVPTYPHLWHGRVKPEGLQLNHAPKGGGILWILETQISVPTYPCSKGGGPPTLGVHLTVQIQLPSALVMSKRAGSDLTRPSSKPGLLQATVVFPFQKMTFFIISTVGYLNAHHWCMCTVNCQLLIRIINHLGLQHTTNPGFQAHRLRPPFITTQVASIHVSQICGWAQLHQLLHAITMKLWTDLGVSYYSHAITQPIFSSGLLNSIGIMARLLQVFPMNGSPEPSNMFNVSIWVQCPGVELKSWSIC